MLNPVVIFLDINRKVGDWKYSGSLSLPYGWDFKGKGHSYKNGKGIAYQLLLLNDLTEIPDPVHANVDPKAPIPVVRHGTSGGHKPQELPAQLERWGVYVPVGQFSHDSGSDTFCKIVDLIEGRLEPATLATQFSIAAQVAHLIELAAVCQIKMLDATADLDELLEPLLGLLPEDFVEEFRAKACDEEGLDRPDVGLREILIYAQTLRS